ncbi:LuxR C-terminal-related transcriptional regulator [Nonomuraea sp. B12E4]|uniref:LuxR C-terminal-related transcriptional regulator n=1 Tax=Nonomuraea sp. B12E4 TaxID=3153564 RepID=UPI00325EB5F5
MPPPRLDRLDDLVAALPAGGPRVRLRRVVASGQSVLAPEATTRMIEALQPPIPTAEDHALLEAARRLTDRARDVCALIAEGLSNDDIAGRLLISRCTVKVHVSSILTKLGLPDRLHVLMAWTRLRSPRSR